MEKKDYFSSQSGEYAAFRPTYPEELYQFVLSHVIQRSCAWDCATGNGQVARHLAGYFDNVQATDISQQQLDHAFRARNIHYALASAESPPFQDSMFDLITVAQALHWFNLGDFYREVSRTGKPGGLLAVWGYALLSVNPEIDRLFMDFYTNITGPYWDKARKLVDNHYRDIPFPFDRIACPEFHMTVQWSSAQFAGYLTSWSAVQTYIGRHGVNPVDTFMQKLGAAWRPGDRMDVTFPLFMKLGRIGQRHG